MSKANFLWCCSCLMSDTLSADRPTSQPQTIATTITTTTVGQSGKGWDHWRAAGIRTWLPMSRADFPVCCAAAERLRPQSAPEPHWTTPLNSSAYEQTRESTQDVRYGKLMGSDANWQRLKAIPHGVVVEHTLLTTRRPTPSTRLTLSPTNDPWGNRYRMWDVGSCLYYKPTGKDERQFPKAVWLNKLCWRLRPLTNDTDRLHHQPITHGGIDIGCEIQEAVCIICQLAKTKGNSAKVVWVMDEGDSLGCDRRPEQLQTTTKEGIE